MIILVSWENSSFPPGARAGAGPGALTQLEPLSSSWTKTWKRSPCSYRTHQKRPPTLNRTTTKNSTTSSTWGTSLRAQVGGGGTPGYETPVIHFTDEETEAQREGWGRSEVTQTKLEYLEPTSSEHSSVFVWSPTWGSTYARGFFFSVPWAPVPCVPHMASIPSVLTGGTLFLVNNVPVLLPTFHSFTHLINVQERNSKMT